MQTDTLDFLFSIEDYPSIYNMEGGNVPDCTSCKLVGAGGCFAGAAYAMFERSKIPSSSKNRVWLSVIGVGMSHSMATVQNMV